MHVVGQETDGESESETIPGSTQILTPGIDSAGEMLIEMIEETPAGGRNGLQPEIRWAIKAPLCLDCHQLAHCPTSPCPSRVDAFRAILLQAEIKVVKTSLQPV